MEKIELNALNYSNIPDPCKFLFNYVPINTLTILTAVVQMTTYFPVLHPVVNN